MSILYKTWGNSFDRLVEHCKHDQIMQIQLAPLEVNKNIDAAT